MGCRHAQQVRAEEYSRLRALQKRRLGAYSVRNAASNTPVLRNVKVWNRSVLPWGSSQYAYTERHPCALTNMAEGRMVVLLTVDCV